MGAARAIARAEGRHGPLLVFAEDRYVGRALREAGGWSEAELALLLRLAKPGATVIEVGAYIGAFTVPLARRVGPEGRVIAFEPQRAAFRLLSRNLRANGLSNVTLHRAAAGAAPGEAAIARPDYRSEGNFGGVALGAGDGRARVLMLDDLMPEPPVRLIKADAEGMEADVLDGAARLIARDRPILHLEADRPGARAALLDRLDRLGYRAIPLAFPAEETVFPGLVSPTILGVPAERRLRSLGDAP